MTTPDYEAYGYEPEHDTRNLFTYVNKNWSYGLPYRIGAMPDGEGGWGVFVQWERGKEPQEGGTQYAHVEGMPNVRNSQRETRFDAAWEVENAMEEYSEENYGPRGGSTDPEFDIGGGL